METEKKLEEVMKADGWTKVETKSEDYMQWRDVWQRVLGETTQVIVIDHCMF